MAKWEFAALVLENHIWYLVKPANVEPAEIKYDKGGNLDDPRTANFGNKWQNPTTWDLQRRLNNTYQEILNFSRINPEVLDDGSQPDILFNSRDLLTLINLAGAEGWEITGGIGFADGYGRNETRYRMMRREL